MSTSKIKALVLLGLAGAWAFRRQKRKQAKLEQAQSSNHTLASLVGGMPEQDTTQKVPSAENPFPKGNPTVIPTGAGPGG